MAWQSGFVGLGERSVASGVDQNGGISKQAFVRDTLLELVGGLEVGAAIPP
jgi:hypothetical protein